MCTTPIIDEKKNLTNLYIYIYVVSLANLASHVIISDLIRLGVMSLQEESSTSSESTGLGALWKPRSCDLEVG